MNGYPIFYPRIALVAPSPGDYLFRLELKLIHASKRGSWSELTKCNVFVFRN